jgi:hypothetical protein
MPRASPGADDAHGVSTHRTFLSNCVVPLSCHDGGTSGTWTPLTQRVRSVACEHKVLARWTRLAAVRSSEHSAPAAAGPGTIPDISRREARSCGVEVSLSSRARACCVRWSHSHAAPRVPVAPRHSEVTTNACPTECASGRTWRHPSGPHKQCRVGGQLEAGPMFTARRRGWKARASTCRASSVALR